MANYAEYRKGGIPSRADLLREKQRYHEFVDDLGRRYFVFKEDYSAQKEEEEPYLEVVYVLLTAQYNNDPEQYTDEEDSTQMPESQSSVLLCANGRKHELPFVRIAVPENVYRRFFRVVGTCALSFPAGVPPIN